MKSLFAVIFLISLLFMQACASSSKFVPKEKILINEHSSISQFQQSFLTATNKARAKGRKCGKKYFPAAPALSLNKNLNSAAHNHSADMYKNNFLEHVSSNGDTLVERMIDAEYSWSAVAENIAHNQKNINQVIADWLSSPGHCSNMMSADYTQTGVAQVHRYWTQVYAKPK